MFVGRVVFAAVLGALCAVSSSNNISITGSVTTPTAGSPYTLNCTVPVIRWNGILTIQLTAPNGSMLISNVSSVSPGMNYTLQWPFSPLHTSDGGLYSCVVSSPGLTSVMTSSVINVTIPRPRAVITSTSALPAHLGDNVNLTCDIQLDPSVDIPVTVVITWFGPGGSLQDDVDTMISPMEYQSTLMLTSLKAEQAGNYTCSTKVTTNNSTYVVPLTLNTTTQVSIHVISITSLSTPLLAGQNYTLYCNGSVLGNLSLTPMVMWSNSNGVVTNGNDITVSNGIIKFNPLHTSHGGQYTCQTALSSPVTSIITSVINVTVQIPPPTVTLTSTPITTSYYAGTPLNLTCTVQLIPQVDTNVIFNSLWTGPGGQISSGVGRVSLSSGVNQTTVQFYPLNTTDTGVYNCSVSVSASGQQYVDTSIAVSSSITSITVKALPAPQVTITSSGSSTAGSPYNLTCTVMVVNGLVVVPQVMWFKNGTSVTGGNGMISANTTTLILQFNPLRTSDGGQYSCIANVSLPVISITSLSNTSASSVIVQIPQPIINITAVALSQVIAIGSNITLTCNIQLDPSVDSNVTVNRTWTGPAGTALSGSAPNKNGSIYQTTLSLISLKTTDVGIYTCSVTVSAVVPQFIVHTTVSGTIQVSAQAVSITASGSPVAGQMYTLTCTGALVGNASIVSTTMWRNAVGGVPTGNDITVSGGTLTFNPLRTSHGGQYTCLSTLTYSFNSTATNMTYVIVQIPPPTVTITSTPITTSYYAGTPLNLTCTVQIIPQVDTNVIFNSLWTGPGGQISSGVGRVSLSSGVNQTTVQFYPLNTTDTGVYNCSVSVSASGQQYVDTSIAVSSSITSITVKALPAPQVTITPSGSSTSGSPYNLTCTVMVVNGLVVVPQVMWFKNGVNVAVGNSISFASSANKTTLTLQYNPLRTSHGGQYSCIANVSLPVISITSFYSNLVSSLAVQIPPPTVTITAAPSQVTTIGGNITLTCDIQLDPSVDSNVTVNSTWTGPNSLTSSSILSSPYQSTLMLGSLTTTSAGNYACSVLVSPFNNTFINQTTQRPTILVSVHAINITTSGSPVAGQVYSLICNGTLAGNTSLIPVVTWRNSTGVVTNGSGITVSNGVFTFNPLHTSHGGQYNCQSFVNSLNISTTAISRSITVQIPPPLLTVSAISNQVVAAGSNLTLLCNVQLDPSVDSTVMVTSTWTAPGGATLNGSNPLWIGSSNQSTLMLTSLGTWNAGSYVCGVSVTPINTQYITGPMRSNASILVSVHSASITTSGSPVAGQVYTLNCSTSLFGNTSLIPVATWRNSTGVVTNGSGITVSNGVLTFNPLHTSHGGQYTCQSVVTSLNISTASAITNVIVQIPTPAVSIIAAIPSPVVPIGSNVTLTCNITLDPSVDNAAMVNTTWIGPGGRIYNGTAPTKNGFSYQSILTLVSLKTTDVGAYNCSVPVTPANPQYIISATGGAIIQVLAQLVTITATGSPSAGQTYTLMCVGSLVGNTSITPVVSWKNSNGVITNGVPPPTVTITSTPITTSYYAGTPLNLTCTVQLIPQVDTNVIFNSLWTGPGGQISSGVGRVSLSSDVNQTTVQFYPLNTTDTGVYNCSVSVSASGQQYVDTSIAVSSSITSITVKALPAPQVTITSSGSSTAGSPYNLTCTVMVVNGLVVVPQVMWFKNGTSVTGGNGMISANTTTLTLQFNPLRTSDGGQYSCIANVSLPVISFTSLYNTSASSVIVQMDSNVTVNRTWTGPAGTTLGGSAPNRNGSIYQTTLSLISLKTTDVGIYTCSVTVSAVPQFIVHTTVSGNIQVTVMSISEGSFPVIVVAGGAGGGIVVMVVLATLLGVIGTILKRRSDRVKLSALQTDHPMMVLDISTSAIDNLIVNNKTQYRDEITSTTFINVPKVDAKGLACRSVVGSVVTSALTDVISAKPIPVAMFFEHVVKMHAENNKCFKEQFVTIPKDFLAPHCVAYRNPEHNRFVNILPYDHNRVLLKQLPGLAASSDYINASFIDGYHKPKAYIAAQGPLSYTLSHFLRMLIELRLTTIVMLTRCMEDGKIKCQQYWPKEQEGTLSIDNFSVHLLTFVSYAEYEVRKLIISDQSSNQSSPLEVTHFHYTGWPDHGVPSNPMSLVHLCRHVRKVHPIAEDTPLLVHCSAGVGRTGTFMALDMIMTEMQRVDQQAIDVHGCVWKLRNQRVQMVQGLDQYVFLHDTISELIVCGDTEMVMADLHHAMNKLQDAKQEGGVSGYEKQYKSLETLCYFNDDEFQHGNTAANKSKNRYDNKVPRDSRRVLLEQENGYINASFVDGYHKPLMFIATQVPMPCTVTDFWRMVMENKCSTIVQLYTLDEEEQKDSGMYYPAKAERTLRFGGFQITKKVISTQCDFTVCKLDVLQPQILGVTHYQYTAWAEDGRPNLPSLLEMVEQVNKAHSSGSGPLVVMCNDGMGRTGTFIATHSCLEQMTGEGTVDVLRTIKAIRIQRPGLVQGVDQYKLCHEALAAHMDKFNIYANFCETVNV
ncbi:hypothetical protein EMCRGX_G018896 [Ephydatia muelleri]